MRYAKLILSRSIAHFPSFHTFQSDEFHAERRPIGPSERANLTCIQFNVSLSKIARLILNRGEFLLFAGRVVLVEEVSGLS